MITAILQHQLKLQLQFPLKTSFQSKWSLNLKMSPNVKIQAAKLKQIPIQIESPRGPMSAEPLVRVRLV